MVGKRSGGKQGEEKDHAHDGYDHPEETDRCPQGLGLDWESRRDGANYSVCKEDEEVHAPGAADRHLIQADRGFAPKCSERLAASCRGIFCVAFASHGSAVPRPLRRRTRASPVQVRRIRRERRREAEHPSSDVSLAADHRPCHRSRPQELLASRFNSRPIASHSSRGLPEPIAPSISTHVARNGLPPHVRRRVKTSPNIALR